MIAFLNPILSAKAPVNGGRKYKPAAKIPPIHPASISVNPTIRDKYNVIAIKTA